MFGGKDTGQIILLSFTTTVIHYTRFRDIMRWHLESDSHRIHMAVEGSVGGTTVGLHIAADVIQSGVEFSGWAYQCQIQKGFHIYLLICLQFHHQNFMP